ncbi:K02A2.6-like [Cordylochernes scorpioides]|uniref:RNA-directed DNA polymerase n=1 Tax=Cordylochernes scorpioides TaxID=51811 RepID=A0ABY6LEX7_9ARAC|nr:K02A2.6-like [Cordylochernes scorpioides]
MFEIMSTCARIVINGGRSLLFPPLIANRLHRWALELSNFDFDIRYTNKDTMLCADAFSRLPLEEINSREDNIDLVTHDISFLNVTPLDHLIIEEETNKDPVLNKLKEYLLEDPQLAKKDETMKPFLSKLENFSILQGCIFVDSRAVIPRTCQDQMLKLLHQGHIGINRMKSLARSSVWWPKMDSQIEEFVKECSPCMHHQTAPPAENTPWPRTNQPWQRVHVDHFYFRGDCYLLVVDANSNWIEVFPVRGTTSQENIKLLRECFARYGLPQCLVSDNGPPFNSLEFKEFLRKNNVYHLTSPAYNPSSNGIAEVSVRIIKKSLEKSLEESPNSNMDCILQNVLFNYRNTPTSLDKPPVERLLSYVPRTFVNCLNSEFIQRTFGRNECGRRHFQVGDKVLFTRVIQNRRKWFKAQVIRRLGYNVYLVKNLKGTFKVHVNQMRTGSDTKYAEDSNWTLDNAGAGPHRLEQDPQISTSPPPRRSTRPRCPPCRGHGCYDLNFQRLAPGFHRRVKAKNSLQDYVVRPDKAALHAARKRTRSYKGQTSELPREYLTETRGLYEFKVMPFGLCNASATFEQMMDNVLKGPKWTICLCYLDDIFSDDFENNLRCLQLIQLTCSLHHAMRHLFWSFHETVFRGTILPVAMTSSRESWRADIFCECLDVRARYRSSLGVVTLGRPQLCSNDKSQ